MIMMLTIVSMALFASSQESGDASEPRLEITGSSTVSAFSFAVADRVRRDHGVDFRLEQTGTNGGFAIFCSPGTDLDIVNASRPVHPAEAQQCRQNGKTLLEFDAGKDGIVLAQSRSAKPLPLSLKHIYLALAAWTPVSETNCTLMQNKRATWRDVDPSLPDRQIEVFGPPDTSGTRDTFFALAIEEGARQFACLSEADTAQDRIFFEQATRLREDGAWVDAGENDDAIVAALGHIKDAIGVFGYSKILTRGDKIMAVEIDGVAPNRETIADGRYPLSRSVWFYTDAEKYRRSEALQRYVREFMSSRAIGSEGYLLDLGLVPARTVKPGMVTYQEVGIDMTPQEP